MRRSSSRKSENDPFEQFVDGKTGSQLDMAWEESGLPLLHECVARGKFHLMLTLLQRGADIDIEGGQLEETALHLAFRQMREGTGPHDWMGSGLHPNGRKGGLMMEANYGLVQMVELLLAYGADVNNRDLEDRTPLDVALHGMMLEEWIPLIKAMLIRAPPEAALKVEEEGLIQMLGIESSVAEWQAQITTRFQERHMALLAAAESGDCAVVTQLLTPHPQDDIESPLLFANDADCDGHTALHFAVRNNKVSAVRCLLDRFADPNYVPKDTAVPSPLYMSCSTLPPPEQHDTRLEIIQILVTATGGVDLPGASGTALQAACECGFLTAAALLLNSNGDRAEVSNGALEQWVAGGADAVQEAYKLWEAQKHAEEAAAAEAAEEQQREEKLSLEREALRRKLTEQVSHTLL